ncbi:LacI family transcriptional regulator [Actinotalea sp. M2MS4P-6]|uniref:LacI family DNA-binding transcriptional regulator n=1 Tax=Actinotalea sp. M2MS4P-6 TaxID=2983762 RepID=UPI0021E49549|nr:LacI family DNA-binding transcriptional regulator [Actinotalea sp. M2MS4P-6]MCV2394319.1 LacI family transcriptional regulator [Actinotalea sp. M2MS4P-6]
MAEAKPTSGRVTLRDVADVVGVTPAAVSMALRGSSRIGKETTERIRAAARELGYVTNSAGRALRAQRSGSIALVVPNTSQHVFGHSYFMHLLVGVSEVGDSRGAPVIISTSVVAEHGINAYERILRSQVADGAIVASAAAQDRDLESLVASGLPVVLIGRSVTLPDAVWVGVDDEAGGELAARHMIEQHGARRIVHVSGPLDHQSAIDRLEGCRRASAAAGLPEPRVIQGDFSEASGVAAGRTLLADGLDGADAIVAANDEMAYGLMRELGAAGVSVPDDLGLIGYDDFGLARVTTPGISTIRVPAELIGRRAASELFGLLDGREPAHRHVLLPVELIARGSCGCPTPAQHD